MMPAFDIWTLAAVLAVLALLATLRQSIPALAGRKLDAVTGLLTSPIWLVPLIFVAYMTVGLMLAGDLSPWPPEARAIFGHKWGAWAGITGFIIVVVVDIWLVWTPSMVARRFAGPDGRNAVKNLPLFNVIFGIAVIALLMLVVAK